MERLWAPWRLQYVTQEKPQGCIFCDKPQENDDRGTYIVHRGERAYVILNAYPYNNGHAMVAPFAHIAEFEELPPETLGEMMGLAQYCVRALKLMFHPDGLNLGFNLGAAAGAGSKTTSTCTWCPGGRAIPISCRSWPTYGSYPSRLTRPMNS